MSTSSVPGSILGIVAPFTGATTGVQGSAGSVPTPPIGSQTKFLSGGGSFLSVTQTGSGSPETIVTGSVGDLYIDTTANHIYYKKTGSNTNTGWITTV